MTQRDTDALFTMLREIRDDMREVRTHVDTVRIEQAQQQGAIRVLKWAVPGGPALVAAAWATMQMQ